MELDERLADDGVCGRVDDRDVCDARVRRANVHLDGHRLAGAELLHVAGLGVGERDALAQLQPALCRVKVGLGLLAKALDVAEPVGALGGQHLLAAGLAKGAGCLPYWGASHDTMSVDDGGKGKDGEQGVLHFVGAVCFELG